MYNSIKIKKSSIFYFSFCVIFVFIDYYVSFSSELINNIIATQIIVFCILNMIKTRNRIVEFLLHFQLFYYNYSIIFSRYLNLVDEYSEFYKYTDTRVLGIGILSIYIFEMIVTYFVHRDSHSINMKNKIGIDSLCSNNPSKIISLSLLIISWIIGIFGFDWSSYGNRGSVSSLYEYTGVLFIIGLYYAGKKARYSKNIRVMYLLTIWAFIIQGLVFGERVSSLQFIFIFVFYYLLDFLKPIHILLGGLLGVILMSAVGVFRNFYTLNSVTFNGVIEQIFNRMLTFDGADMGYYTSLTFIMTGDKVGWGVRLHKFVEFFISVLVGDGGERNLPVFTHNYYSHWYGGFLPLYFYFYSSFTGIAVLTYCISYFIRMCFRRINGDRKIFALITIYIICITSRWYMYSPLAIIRSTLVFLIVFYLMEFVRKSILNK